MRAIRIKKGFSQEQLAAKSGYGVRTIRRIELGRHQPQPRTLKDLADALGVDSEELCSDRFVRRERISADGVHALVADPVLPATGPRARLLSGTPRAPSTSFVGRRAELTDLEEFLTNGGAVSIQASVEGLAGVGKTELALQLAYKLAAQGTFPGGIFWLDAEEPDLRITWGGAIAEQYRVGGSSVEERCRELLRRLEEANEPALVILDNVASWSPSERPAPLPVGPQIRLLITTRVRNLGGAQFMHVDTSFLAAPHDRDLVLRLARRNPDPGLDRLLAHLAGHTLAIEMAGAFLGTYAGESAQSYHAALQEKGETIEAEVQHRVGYGGTVAESFRATWSRIDPSVREAWKLAACFAAAPASRELAAAVGLTSEGMRALEELHLIRRDPADGRWSMHRLTHDFGRNVGLPHERGSAAKRFVEGCWTHGRIVTRNNWVRVYLPDRPHFEAALALGAEVFPEDAEPVLDLRHRVGGALDAMGDFDGARLLWRQVADACRSRLKSGSVGRNERAALHGRLANALSMLAEREQGTVTSEECVHAYRSALQNLDRDQAPGVWAGTQSMLAYALLRLGADRRDAALLAESVSAQRTALEQLTLDNDLVGWAEAQRHLATALMTLGRMTGVDAYVDEAEAATRAILERCSREELPTTWAFALHRHSIILRTIGERTGHLNTRLLEEALHGFETLLEEWTYEQSPREWFTTQNNVASTLLSLGRATKSVERLHEGVRAVQHVLARSNPRSDTWVDAQELLGSLFEALAVADNAVGHLSEAHRAYHACVEGRDRARFQHRWAEAQLRMARVLRKLMQAGEPASAHFEEATAALDRAREIWHAAGFAEGLDAIDWETARLGDMSRP